MESWSQFQNWRASRHIGKMVSKIKRYDAEIRGSKHRSLWELRGRGQNLVQGGIREDFVEEGTSTLTAEW